MIKSFFEPLEAYWLSIQKESETIHEERKALLSNLVDYVQGREEKNLIFICTHNSRRSQLAEVWAYVAAQRHGVHSVHTYSGGTEATAFEPRAVAALERAGFHIEAGQEASNPSYSVAWNVGSIKRGLYSQVYDHPDLPSEQFAAVMVCSSADENCPFIPGASARISLTYEDPKAFDNTDQESEAYDARCRQIASEMNFVMQRVAQLKSSS